MTVASIPITTGSLTMVTYVWHYVVARLVYDQLLRPAIHGHVVRTLLVVCAVPAAGFAIGRLRGRERTRSRRRA